MRHDCAVLIGTFFSFLKEVREGVAAILCEDICKRAGGIGPWYRVV
jgi:hypothetical protein